MSSSLPPSVQRLGWSVLAAQCSEQIALAAAPLVAVLWLGAGAAETGWLQTVHTLPFLMLALPAGLLADRWSRKRLMKAAEWVRAGSLVVVMILIATGQLTLPALAILGFAGAVGTVAYSVAAPALLPLLAAREHLSDANRWMELARSAAFSAGPAIGGAIVGWVGGSPAFAMAVLLSLLAITLLAGLPDDVRPSVPSRRQLLDELREGAAFVFRHEFLRPVFMTAVVFNTAWFLLQAVYVLYAVERLGLDATGVGATLAVYGLGMLFGAWISPRLSGRVSFGRQVAVGPFVALAASGLMLATVAVPSGVLAATAFFLFGAGPILWTIATTTLRQAVTPNDLLGRVSATIVTATFGARPVGAAIGALLAGTFGIEACLLASTLLFALQAAIIATSLVPALKDLPAAA